MTRILLSFVWIILCALSIGAGYRTKNFVVTAPTSDLAKGIGDAAEYWRREMAIEWVGKEFPGWTKPCPISVRVGRNMGAGGATSFVFDKGEVFDWNMKIQGTEERLMDSVLPHEITHTIFASYFRQPLPRWADEGACSTVEHQDEKVKQVERLIRYIKEGRFIPFERMMYMTEYPSDVLVLYAQGHSVADWLIKRKDGRRRFVRFLEDGFVDNNWGRAVKKAYGFNSLLEMQDAWLEWVKR